LAPLSGREGENGELWGQRMWDKMCGALGTQSSILFFCDGPITKNNQALDIQK